MNAKFLFKFIHSDAVLFDDYSYSLSPDKTGEVNEALTESIRQYGILHPPIVLQQEEKKYIIITGRKRINIALDQARHDSPLLCLCLSPETTDPVIMSFILEESLTGRQLSPAEQAVFFKKARERGIKSDLLVDFLKKLGHKPQQHIVDNLIELLSLGKEAIMAVHKGVVPYNNARKLLKLSEADQKILVSCITQFNLGGSKQKKLIDLCTELTLRTKESLSTILDRYYKNTTPGREENIPQQSSALLDWLNKECFPHLSNARINFERQISQLNLPPQYRLQHSKSFENDTVILSINFSNFTSMKNVLTDVIQATTEEAENF